MRWTYLALLLSLAFPTAVNGQTAPTEAFRGWARGHAHSIASAEDFRDDAGAQALRSIIGGAHVVALGEPFHGGTNPWRCGTH